MTAGSTFDAAMKILYGRCPEEPAVYLCRKAEEFDEEICVRCWTREIFRDVVVSAENSTWVPKHKDAAPNQMSMFGNAAYQEVIERIRELDLSGVTPIDALNLLYRLQDEINKTDS